MDKFSKEIPEGLETLGGTREDKRLCSFTQERNNLPLRIIRHGEHWRW